jgi:hypothetical protein
LVLNVPIEAESLEQAQTLFAAYCRKKNFAHKVRTSAKMGKVDARLQQVTNTKNRATAKWGEPTLVQKFLAWYDNLPEGTEYDNAMIHAIIGGTGRSVNSMKMYAPAVREILLRDQITHYNAGLKIGHTICYRKGKVAA